MSDKDLVGLSIGVVGEISVGKSALINALLSKPLIVSKMSRQTLCCTKYTRNGGKAYPVLSTSTQTDELQIVNLPGYDYSIIDFPGLNDTKDFFGMYKKYLPQCNVILFITSADRPLITQSENNLFKQITEIVSELIIKPKILLVVNKYDTLHHEEINGMYDKIPELKYNNEVVKKFRFSAHQNLYWSMTDKEIPKEFANEWKQITRNSSALEKDEMEFKGDYDGLKNYITKYLSDNLVLVHLQTFAENLVKFAKNSNIDTLNTLESSIKYIPTKLLNFESENTAAIDQIWNIITTIQDKFNLISAKIDNTSMYCFADKANVNINQVTFYVLAYSTYNTNYFYRMFYVISKNIPSLFTRCFEFLTWIEIILLITNECNQYNNILETTRLGEHQVFVNEMYDGQDYYDFWEKLLKNISDPYAYIAASLILHTETNNYVKINQISLPEWCRCNVRKFREVYRYGPNFSKITDKVVNVINVDEFLEGLVNIFKQDYYKSDWPNELEK